MTNRVPGAILRYVATSTVCSTLADELRTERLCGVDFDEAWRRAVKCAVRAAPYSERKVWREVLAETRDAWLSAYYEEVQVTGHRALTILSEVGR
jgi:hypothetical protein